MSECPNCERYKASASAWRNVAYRVTGHPLPWSPDEKLLQRALDALDRADKISGYANNKEIRAALRTRLEEKA